MQREDDNCFLMMEADLMSRFGVGNATLDRFVSSLAWQESEDHCH